MCSIIKKRIPQQEMHLVEWYVKDQLEHHRISGQQSDGTINLIYAKIIKKPVFVVLEVYDVAVYSSFDTLEIDADKRTFISQIAASFFMIDQITNWDGN